MDISWFMRYLNESIAREANREGNCSGQFWEGRFKSQALLDEKALVACMAYVDLNPVRAGMAQTPEQSEYTAIAEWSAQLQRATRSKGQPSQPRQLLPFVGHPRAVMPKGLPFQLIDYLELLDWSGRTIRENKHGFIPKDQLPILERFQIDPKTLALHGTAF